MTSEEARAKALKLLEDNSPTVYKNLRAIGYLLYADTEPMEEPVLVRTTR